MNRRSFVRMTCGAAAAFALAPLVPLHEVVDASPITEDWRSTTVWHRGIGLREWDAILLRAQDAHFAERRATLGPVYERYERADYSSARVIRESHPRVRNDGDYPFMKATMSAPEVGTKRFAAGEPLLWRKLTLRERVRMALRGHIRAAWKGAAVTPLGVMAQEIAFLVDESNKMIGITNCEFSGGATPKHTPASSASQIEAMR